MRGFSTSELTVRTGDGLKCTLVEFFSYGDKDGTIHTVPAGTTSDGASTPPIIWEKFNLPWIPPFGWYWLATFLHDWAYRISDLPKEKCDELLLEAMEWLIDEQVRKGEAGFFTEEEERLKAKTIYEGVHLAGWSSFEGDRKAQKPAA